MHEGWQFLSVLNMISRGTSSWAGFWLPVRAALGEIGMADLLTVIMQRVVKLGTNHSCKLVQWHSSLLEEVLNLLKP